MIGLLLGLILFGVLGYVALMVAASLLGLLFAPFYWTYRLVRFVCRMTARAA
jgi:hypothetical protein